MTVCKLIAELLESGIDSYVLLSMSGEVMAVSGKSEFDDIDNQPDDEGIILHVVGRYIKEEIV